MKRAILMIVLLLMAGSAMPAEPVTIHIAINPTGFHLVEFADVAGIVMTGQTLPLEFLFDPIHFIGPSTSSILSELTLYTGPHNLPNPNGDFPYSQYVVFAPGTVAYVLSEDGTLLQTPMADFLGGVTTAPAPTLPVLVTDHGVAGADMIAYLSQGAVVAGIHFDLVLPNTGQALYAGQLGVIVNNAAEPSSWALLALGVVALGVMARWYDVRRWSEQR
jgi:hypothetical protein